MVRSMSRYLASAAQSGPATCKHRAVNGLRRPCPSGAQIVAIIMLTAFCVRRSPGDSAAATGWSGERRPMGPLAVSLPCPYRIVSVCRSAAAKHTRGSPTLCQTGARRERHFAPYDTDVAAASIATRLAARFSSTAPPIIRIVGGGLRVDAGPP